MYVYEAENEISSKKGVACIVMYELSKMKMSKATINVY